jgi:ribosomal protein S18 acetylase RimI-like enzyme
MPVENIEKKFSYDFVSAREEDLQQIEEIESRAEEHREYLQGQAEGVGHFFTARFGDRIIGYVFLYNEHESAHFPGVKAPFIEDLMVRPDFRGQGVGQQLMQQCEEKIKDQGGSVATLAVLADNQAAREFYERNGYEPVAGMEFAAPNGAKGFYYKKELK